MSEQPRWPELISQLDPYDAFDALSQMSEWSGDVDRQLKVLYESHEMDLFMIYRVYRDSGRMRELSEYERRLYDWLHRKFEDRTKESR